MYCSEGHSTAAKERDWRKYCSCKGEKSQFEYFLLTFPYPMHFAFQFGFVP